jgi:hemerythrin superfamily protein
VPLGIDLILADHRRVDELFATFAETGDGHLIGQMIDALAAHDDAEHSALYPMVGMILGDAGMVERCAAAHSAVKKQIDVIKSLEGPPLAAAVAVLQQLVTAHVQDEEQNVLPALEQAATDAQLDELGARFEQTKQRVG